MTIDAPVGQTVKLHSVTAEEHLQAHAVDLPNYERERFDDVAFMTAMNLCLLGNYAQTGHFGGPLAYTPYNVACHLAGPALGGLRYDLREPKFPFSDKFMLAGGHCIPTCYSLWMILYEALRRQHEATGDDRFGVDPEVAILAIDALGFRRGAGVLETLLDSNGLADHPLFAQAKIRGIRSLSVTPNPSTRPTMSRWPLRDRHCHGRRESRVLGLHRRWTGPKGDRARRRVRVD